VNHLARPAIEAGRVHGTPEDPAIDDPVREIRLLVGAGPAEREQLAFVSHQHACRLGGIVDAERVRHPVYDVVCGANADKLARHEGEQ
jgi:hypothetical protein